MAFPYLYAHNITGMLDKYLPKIEEDEEGEIEESLCVSNLNTSHSSSSNVGSSLSNQSLRDVQDQTSADTVIIIESNGVEGEGEAVDEGIASNSECTDQLTLDSESSGDAENVDLETTGYSCDDMNSKKTLPKLMEATEDHLHSHPIS